MEQQIAILLLTFGLLASLYLAMQIKVEMRRSDLNRRKELEQIRFQLQEHRSNWIETARRQNPIQPPPPVAPVVTLKPEVTFPLRASATPPHSSRNWGVATKAQAIEMVRKGESSSNISEALSLPKPEVEFLIKMERASNEKG